MPVEELRSLATNSVAQERAKKKLPLVTWAGEFSRRDGNSLVKPSGLIGMDLDYLDSDKTRSVMHSAMDDPHCAAAFRSARGQGVRLVLRVPPVSAPQYRFVFDAAAAHVRGRYGIEPDGSGKDIARASFVSFDGGLWLNSEAVVLPMVLPEEEIKQELNTMTHCVKLPLPWWVWLAREYIPRDSKPDGSVLTHWVLLELGKRLAFRIDREHLWRGADSIIEHAASEWFDATLRRGLRLRGDLREYSDELRGIVLGVRKCTWFSKAAVVWTQWKKDPNFPHKNPKKALLFAIERHCEKENNRHFYLSSRDAALIIEMSNVTAANKLTELCKDGYLRRSKGERPARHAAEFELQRVTPKQM